MKTNNIDSLQTELEKIDKQRAVLENRLKAEVQKLQALPAMFGLKTHDALIEKLLPFSTTYRAKFGMPATSVVATKAPTQPVVKASKSKDGKRVFLTPEQKEEVKKKIMAGATAPEIKAQYGIGAATIFLWKNDWGLTKKKSKPAAAAPKPAAQVTEAPKPIAQAPAAPKAATKPAQVAKPAPTAKAAKPAKPAKAKKAAASKPKKAKAKVAVAAK